VENGTSLSKSHLERTICGMSTRGWKECRRRRTFSVTRRLITKGYPKKRVFGKFDPLVETFVECETMCREPPSGHVFAGRLAEIDPRKVAEVVRGSCHKNNASATHFLCSLRNP